MKIILFSRPSSSISAELLGALIESIEGRGMDYAVGYSVAEWLAESADKHIDESHLYDHLSDVLTEDAIVISYGGDGTLLSAVRSLGGATTPVLGINSGRLGFLTTAGKGEFESVLDALQDGRYDIETRSLLKIEGEVENEVSFSLAFNEFSIQRDRMSMVAIRVEIDDHLAAEYWSDGAIVATPTGSTAYSLSAGGPIVAPECRCIVITPIAPHNLTLRPLIIPESSTVRLVVESRDGHALAGIDNESLTVPSGATFTISKAKEEVFLIKLQNISFYDTLRDKMMWGLDGRKTTS